MFDFSTLITNRSASDLENLRSLLSTPVSDWTAAQLAEFNQAISKGAYNYTDLNRVTAAMTYLDQVLQGYGYTSGFKPLEIKRTGGTVEPLLPDGYKQLWYETDIPTQSEMTQYLTNVLAVTKVFIEEPQLPQQMAGLTVDGANQIETALFELWKLLEILPTSFVPCGEAFCGGDNL